ncbi:hypothetical protein POTOM_003010 [Populus tomentosa]|uniref:Mannosyltransferase n=1 Tax=Populus tomentosa TaxID=118781 RepID=A0A8X8IYG6_POPTO|nr:hypothetical protein POTOM_003010 [Populus tomentosa]
MTFYSLGRRFKPNFSAGAVTSVVLLVSPLLAGVYVFATARRRKVPLSNIPLSLGAFLIFSETSIIPRTILGWFWSVVLGLILSASQAHMFSLINGYGARFEAYKILEHYDDVGKGMIYFGVLFCVRSEWHRLLSSFYVPEYISAVRWIDDGFRGLLPLPFNSTPGGNAAAPPYFNNKNRASDEQYIRDLEACTFLVELQLDRHYPTRGSDLSTWELIAALPFLDRELSPPMYRSFFIPHLWQEKNVFGMYKLLERVSM